MANNPYVKNVQLAHGTTLIDISDTTAVASDVASGKYFYNAAGAKVQGTATIGGLSITEYADSHGGTVLDINGPVTSIDVQSKSTSVTPTKSAQTVTLTPDSGYAGLSSATVDVAAIPVAYITTTDATATAAQINSGATAYVNGVKVTGTQVIQTYYTGSSAPSASLGNDGDIYLEVVS